MNNHSVLFQAIKNLKVIKVELNQNEELNLAVHCIEMAILELTQIEESKIIITENSMIDYMGASPTY